MLISAAFSLLAAGCAAPDSFGGSRQAAAAWASERGLTAATLHAGQFELAAFLRRPSMSTGMLTIYVEGDGAPWPTPYHPPRDPTPLQPTSLALAAADPAPAVAYLGRPCQYLERESLAQCPSAYWTERRFAPEVVDAYDSALTQLKSMFGAGKIVLIGYSGGGVIAALLAGRREDVAALITVAAPLAVAEWVKWHGISALTGSLDPAEAGEAGAPLPRGVHFAGADDKTVPTTIVARFVQLRGGRMEIISGFDHACCWTRDWKSLLLDATVQENVQ